MTTEFGVEEGIESRTEPGEPARPPVRYDQSWLTSLLRPLLIVALVACLDVALGAVLSRFGVDLPRGFAAGLTVLAVIAATVGVITTSMLAQPSQRPNRTVALRAAEIALFLTAARLFVWFAGFGVPPLQQMLERPLNTLLDFPFLGAAAIVGMSWYIASEVTSDLSRLALSADEIRMAERRSDRSGDAMRGAAIDRRAVLNAFTMRWATLGLILILLAAMVRRGFDAKGFFGLLRQDVESPVMIAIVLYFLVGLVLISTAQLALLRARWTIEQTPSDGSVTRRWPILVILLLVVFATVAAFLPLGGTFLLALVLSALIGGVMALLLLAQQLFLLGIVWVASLFSSGATTPPPPPPPPIIPNAADLPRFQPVMPTWFGGTLFWVAIAALVAYAGYVYLHDRGVRFTWLAWLIGSLRRRYAEARRLVRVRLQRANLAEASLDEGGRRGSLLDWLRRGPHGPDEEVRYLYLATLQAAEEAGLARATSETPLHYAPRLEAAVEAEPEAAFAAQELTEAFVGVRYARHHPSGERMVRLRARWESLRRELGRRT